jgi:hypothetical protein
MHIVNNRLVRYNVLVAKIIPPKGKKKEAAQAIQQLALDSWLNAASKVILLNRPEGIPYLKVKGVVFEEKYADAPTVNDALLVLSKELPENGYGVLLEDRVILDAKGPDKLNRVRLAAQLSKAWACVAALEHEDSSEEGTVLGTGGAAFWISKNVAKYLKDTCKNPPYLSEYPEWAEWLQGEIKMRVLGHRFFDATAHKLGKVIAEKGAKFPNIVLPFTRH